MGCPHCGGKRFYLESAEDGLECREFDYINGEVCMDDEEGPDAAIPEDDTQTHCSQCSWHGTFDKLKH